MIYEPLSDINQNHIRDTKRERNSNSTTTDGHQITREREQEKKENKREL